MQIVFLTPDKYEEWNKFCLENDEAWFWHTTDWIEYTLNFKPELNTQNLSFLVYKGDVLKAVVLLTLETHQYSAQKIKELSFGGWFIPLPALANGLSTDERGEALSFIFEYIDRLASQHKVVRSRFRGSPLAPNFWGSCPSGNPLIEFGYLDTSLNTLIIDLNKSEEELWNDLRRNHRRNINKGEGFKINFYTQTNITSEIFRAYKEMHHKAAGRQTRPDKTFELMYEWLTKDLAFLVVAELDKKLIGFEYYSVYKNNVYGFSAANDPDYANLPIRHSIEWQAILWMKKRSFYFYEIGLQQYGNLLHDFPDKKQLNISHFKKGFGGGNCATVYG
ncbi:MAG: GNAT family N-acetyltransferase [Patescibacteria group bacterium]